MNNYIPSSSRVVSQYQGSEQKDYLFKVNIDITILMKLAKSMIAMDTTNTNIWLKDNRLIFSSDQDGASHYCQNSSEAFYYYVIHLGNSDLAYLIDTDSPPERFQLTIVTHLFKKMVSLAHVSLDYKKSARVIFCIQSSAGVKTLTLRPENKTTGDYITIQCEENRDEELMLLKKIDTHYLIKIESKYYETWSKKIGNMYFNPFAILYRVFSQDAYVKEYLVLLDRKNQCEVKEKLFYDLLKENGINLEDSQKFREFIPINYNLNLIKTIKNQNLKTTIENIYFCIVRLSKRDEINKYNQYCYTFNKNRDGEIAEEAVFVSKWNFCSFNYFEPIYSNEYLDLFEDFVRKKLNINFSGVSRKLNISTISEGTVQRKKGINDLLDMSRQTISAQGKKRLVNKVIDSDRENEDEEEYQQDGSDNEENNDEEREEEDNENYSGNLEIKEDSVSKDFGEMKINNNKQSFGGLSNISDKSRKEQKTTVDSEKIAMQIFGDQNPFE